MDQFVEVSVVEDRGRRDAGGFGDVAKAQSFQAAGGHGLLHGLAEFGPAGLLADALPASHGGSLSCRRLYCTNI